MAQQPDKPTPPNPTHRPSADPAPAVGPKTPIGKPDLPNPGTGTVTPDRGR